MVSKPYWELEISKMYLNKLLLKDFGKFNNKEIGLKPGINLIYGEDGSGKTTVKDFVVAMLYGIDKTRGAEDDSTICEERRPRDGRGFSGKAYVRRDGRNYFIERSFLKHSRKVSVMDVQSGRDVKLAGKDSLYGTLLDMDKSTYESVMCIEAQQGNADDRAETLNNYLANLSKCAAPDLDKNMAVHRLKEKKDSQELGPIDRQLDELAADLEQYKDVDEQISEVRKQIQDVDQEFAMETARRKREARKLIETGNGVKYEDNEELNDSLDELTQNSVFLDADLLKDYKQEKKLTDRIWFIILTGLFVIGIITAMVYILPFENGVRQLFVICTTLFVIMTIVEGLYAKGVFDGEVQTPSEEDFKRIIYELERKNETYEDVEIDMSYASEFMERKEVLRGREKELLDRKQKKHELEDEQAVLGKKKNGIEREIHAINLAINTINELSSDIQKKYCDIINGNIADIISCITDGKYVDASLDGRFRLSVKSNNKLIDITKVPREDIGNISNAVRICAARKMCRSHMPVILDDIFTGCDDRAITHTLDSLKAIDTEQIILLTSDKRIKGMLDKTSAEYNYVEL